MNAKNILKGFDKAKSDRVVWENTWEDLAYYVIPRKRGIQTRYEPGERMQFDVYDDTAIQSNLILAAGLSGYMTNAAQRWFQLRTRDERLMEEDGVRAFFDDCEETMFSVLGASNFYQQIHETYLDLGSIGTASLYEEEDPQEDVRFYSRPPKEVYCIENEREQIDMVYRYFEMTAYKAYNFFGKDKCGSTIVKAVEEQKDYGKIFKFIHHVGPRHKRDVGKRDSVNKPFFSYWVSEADCKIVKEGGYEEFPFFSTRFYKNSNEVYGYAPSFVCLPDILMLNQMMKVYIEGAEIAIYPPWLMESDSIIGTLDLRAAAVNYQRQPLSQGRAVEPMNSGMKGNVAIDFINRTEGNIKAAYFTDLFLMLTQNHNMTATEVIERTQEKMLMLGPVLGRLQSELLNPIIRRTFNILLRRGKFPQVPEALLDAEYDVIYVSPLAKAQRAVQAKDMQTFLSVVGGMAQFSPEVLDNINADKFVDKLSKIYSVDPDVLHEKSDIKTVREQRAQAQKVQSQMAMMSQMGELGKTASESNVNNENARQANTQ